MVWYGMVWYGMVWYGMGLPWSHRNDGMSHLSIPAGQARWPNTELAPALVVEKLGHGGLDGMIWYDKGLPWSHRKDGLQHSQSSTNLEVFLPQ